jgi:NTP pyrophosphatase (non-canonical NTP hydrolase)
MNERIREILIITQEEAGEVIQEIAKCFRFGLDGTHKSGLAHREMLEQEVGDLMLMCDLLMESGVITAPGVEAAKHRKRAKLRQWSNIFSESSKDVDTKV